ncbi:type 2 periplasmic-binding domain-containing protein [Tenacibaculum xiamenense]|uniref:hypothetical protein n=1 Tax=Tenacibaculum xiamenense TaxID=1261553 RepID=UPI003895A88D
MAKTEMKHVFFEGNEESGKIIMNDLTNIKNVKIIYRDVVFSSKIWSRLFNIHMSPRLNRLVNLPFKKMWFKKLIGNDFSVNDSITFTFIAGWFNKELLSWLRSKFPNSKQVLFLRDTVSIYEKVIPSFNAHLLNDLFDLVISSNPDDCSKYEFKYSPVFISKFEEESLVKYPKTDVVFIAEAKDRLQLLHRIYEKFTKFDINCDFYITSAREKDKKYPDGINYAKNHLNYRDYLSREAASDCIIEIIKSDTQGGTLRSWEAVYYNKKLITNWKGIKKFQFYDERFMMYFEDVEDINMDFFKENLDVEYHYNGENSPVNLLDIIENNLS